MKIDIKRITKPNQRNQIFIGLDPIMLEESDFKPGTFVNLIYERGKITITKEIKEVKI